MLENDTRLGIFSDHDLLRLLKKKRWIVYFFLTNLWSKSIIVAGIGHWFSGQVYHILVFSKRKFKGYMEPEEGRPEASLLLSRRLLYAVLNLIMCIWNHLHKHKSPWIFCERDNRWSVNFPSLRSGFTSSCKFGNCYFTRGYSLTTIST